MRGYARVSLGVVIAGALLLSMASGASAAKAPVAHAASCNWAAAYGPLFGDWSRSYQSDCWYTTTIVHYPKTYVSWEVVDGSDAQACVQAKGYRWRDGAAYWTSLGCGTSGGGYVHWGAYWHQVIDYHHVKVKSLMYPLGAPIYFK